MINKKVKNSISNRLLNLKKKTKVQPKNTPLKLHSFKANKNIILETKQNSSQENYFTSIKNYREPAIKIRKRKREIAVSVMLEIN